MANLATKLRGDHGHAPAPTRAFAAGKVDPVAAAVRRVSLAG